MEAATIPGTPMSGTVNVAASLWAPALLELPRPAHVAARQHYFRRMIGLLEDAVLLMLVALLVPLVILLVGAPIALGVRAVVEIAHAFF